jgi:hypothetical protein
MGAAARSGEAGAAYPDFCDDLAARKGRLGPARQIRRPRAGVKQRYGDWLLSINGATLLYFR